MIHHAHITVVSTYSVATYSEILPMKSWWYDQYSRNSKRQCVHHCAYIRMTSANAQAMTLPLLDNQTETDKNSFIRRNLTIIFYAILTYLEIPWIAILYYFIKRRISTQTARPLLT